jgi:hypothetical protein
MRRLPKVQDPILWGALGCALVGTAHSEWSLAVSVGAHPWIAAAVPGALDLYVIRALQVRRDVFVAVLAMVAANVAWYLVHSHDLPVDWPLRSAVGAVAPLVVWRVHSLKYTRTRAELLWGTPAGAVSAPEETAPETAPAASAHAAWCGLTHPDDGPCSEYGYPPAPDHVPADWMEAEYPETYPGAAVLAAQEDEYADKWGPGAHPEVHLRPVPALPGGFDPVSAVHSAPDLAPGDSEYIALAQEYILTTGAPSVRGLKKYASVGQARAERLLAHLETEES